MCSSQPDTARIPWVNVGDKNIRVNSGEKTYYTKITRWQTHTTVKLKNQMCNPRDPRLVVTGYKNLSKVQTGKLFRIISVVVFGPFPTNLSHSGKTTTVVVTVIQGVSETTVVETTGNTTTVSTF